MASCDSTATNDSNSSSSSPPLLTDLDLADLILPEDREWWYSQPWAEDWGQTRRLSFLHSFLTKAPFQDGIPLAKTSSSPLLPTWFSPSLAPRGRTESASNLAILVPGIVASLTFGRTFKNVSALFVRHYHNSSSFRSMSSTIKAVLAYNLGDHSDASSSFFKEINRVCDIHRAQVRSAPPPQIPPPGVTFPSWYKDTLSAVKCDIQATPFPHAHLESLHSIMSWDPPLRYSQMDAAIVGSILLLISFLDICKGRRDMDLGALLHNSALTSSGLGVSDEFNLGLVRDPGILMGLIRVIILFCLGTMDETNLYMVEGSLGQVQASDWFQYPTSRTFLYFMLDLAGVKPERLWGLMSVRDKVSWYVTKVGLQLYLKFGCVRESANGVIKLLVKGIL